MQTALAFRRRSFYALLGMLLAVLVIPMCLIFISFSATLPALILDDYISLNAQTVQNVINTIDTYMASRMDFIAALGNNKTLRSLAANLGRSGAELSEDCGVLHTSLKGMQTLDNVFALWAIYLPDRDVVISSLNSQQSAANFYKNSVSFIGMDANAFYGRITESKAIRFYPVDEVRMNQGIVYKRMLYVQPLLMGYLRCRAYFISLIDERAFTKLFAGAFDESAHFRLLDSTGSELMASNDFPDAWRAPLEGKAHWSESYNDARYHAFGYTGERTKLKYVFYMPESAVLKRLTLFERVWLITLLACACVGLITARYMARRIYAPITRLVTQAFPKGLAPGARSLAEECALVSEEMRKAQIQNTEFQKELKRNYLAARDNMLLKLLTQSDYLTGEELDEAAQLCGLPTNMCAYQVALCRGLTEAPPPDSAQTEDTAVLYMRLSAAQAMYVAAFPAHAPISPLEELFGAREGGGAGVSRRASDIRMLRRLFVEASYACAQTDAQTPDAGAMYYPIERETQIIASVRAGAFDEARQLLTGVMDVNLNERHVSAEILRCLYTGMVATALKASDGARDIEYSATVSAEKLLMHLNEPGAPAERAFADILALYKSLCAHMQNINESRNARIVASIREYLEANYSDPALCMDSVSDNFNISYYYLSRIFKEETRQGFSDMLNAIRVERAAELLAATSLNVQDIAAQVGYTSLSTFMRAFRKRYGTTPLVYRKENG